MALTRLGQLSSKLAALVFLHHSTVKHQGFYINLWVIARNIIA